MNPRQQLPRLVHPATVQFCRQTVLWPTALRAGWSPLNKRHFFGGVGVSYSSQGRQVVIPQQTQFLSLGGWWQKWSWVEARQISQALQPLVFFSIETSISQGWGWCWNSIAFKKFATNGSCRRGVTVPLPCLPNVSLWGDSMDWHPFAWRPAGWRCWKWMRTVVRSGWLVDIQQFAVCFGTVLAV